MPLVLLLKKKSERRPGASFSPVGKRKIKMILVIHFVGSPGQLVLMKPQVNLGIR